MKLPKFRLSVILFALSIAACGDDTTDDTDNTNNQQDAGTDSAPDTVNDVAEVSEDVAEETSNDSTEDSAEETSEDMVADSTEDTAEDTTEDTADADDASEGDTVADTDATEDADAVADAEVDSSDAGGDLDVTDEEVTPERVLVVGGTDCANAVSITEGLYRFDTSGLTNDHGLIGDTGTECQSRTNGGIDTVFSITVPARTAYRVAARASSELVYLVAVDDCVDLATDACLAKGQGVVSEFNTSDSPVTRLLIIDSSPSEPLTGDVEFDLTFIPEEDFATGQTCDDPIVLSGTGGHSITGDSSDFINRYDSYPTASAFLPGAEYVYQITVPSGWEVVNDWHGSGRTTGFADTCNDDELGMVRNFFNENLVRNSGDSEVTWFYIVDDFETNAGTFDFSITIRETL